MRRAAVFLVAGALTLGVGACSSDPNSIASQAKSGDRKGYVSGDGTIENIAAGKRQKPVELKGTTLDGAAWDSASQRGKVVVINVWGSWCGPCEAEAPELKKAWDTASARGKAVQFVGIDFREDPQRGLASQKKHGITYPSLTDESGVLILALQGKAPTVPSTLVLDRQGRIAARVSGPVSATTLGGLVDDALAESA